MEGSFGTFKVDVEVIGKLVLMGTARSDHVRNFFLTFFSINENTHTRGHLLPTNKTVPLSKKLLILFCCFNVKSTRSSFKKSAITKTFCHGFGGRGKERTIRSLLSPKRSDPSI